ncbi:unnamed protein product [Ilex paraguariensis]|uniref:Uncharacterized protein n=1 Tax=Ilex paraguariensis TaxID=185542 RepID=A0ABC8UHG9_9AQUA
MYVSFREGVNLDIYYRVPRYSLDMRVKQMRSECDVIELLKCYEDLSVVVIYIDKCDDLLSVLSSNCARDTVNTMDDEVDVNINEQIQDSDTLKTDSNENDYVVNTFECYDSDEYSEDLNWIYEDIQGPDDDDIFRSDFPPNGAETSINQDVGPSQSNKSTDGVASNAATASNTVAASNAAAVAVAVASTISPAFTAAAASITGPASTVGAACTVGPRSGAVRKGSRSSVLDNLNATGSVHKTTISNLLDRIRAKKRS